MRPTLRFAFSRPGLVTFKSEVDITPDDVPASVFARVWGQSIGPATDPADAARQVATLGPTLVHLFARDPEADLALLEPWAAALRDTRTGAAVAGDLVADVIVSTDEPAWIGLHRHGAHHLPLAGGAIKVDMPADAPSRAYAKIEEAIQWAGLRFQAGQVALEIGAAPGGAVMALARRGLEVHGVDTGELAPQVRALPGVHHVPMKVGALRWEQLPPRIDWLLVDVNLAPQVALHEVARLMPRLRPTLIGAVFTLKLNDFAFVDALPTLTKRIADLGFATVRLRHLPSNRREICVVALRG